MAVETAALMYPSRLPGILFFGVSPNPWVSSHSYRLALLPTSRFYIQNTPLLGDTGCPAFACQGPGGVSSRSQRQQLRYYPQHVAVKGDFVPGSFLQRPSRTFGSSPVFSKGARGCQHTGWCRPSTVVTLSSQNGYFRSPAQICPRLRNAFSDASTGVLLAAYAFPPRPGRSLHKGTCTPLLQSLRSIHSGMPQETHRSKECEKGETASAHASEEAGQSCMQKAGVSCVPTLCLGVAVHRDVVGYALIQPPFSWFPLKVGFINPAGAGDSFADRAAEVTGVLLALRQQQEPLLQRDDEGISRVTIAGGGSDSPRRLSEGDATSSEGGKSLFSSPLRACYWIVGMEETLRVPQNYRESMRAAQLQQLKGAIGTSLLKVFGVPRVVQVEPKSARTALGRVIRGPLTSREDLLSFLGEQVPSFPKRFCREEAALSMADAWLVAVHAQRVVESTRLREKVKRVSGSVREGGRTAIGKISCSQVSPNLAKLLERVQAPSSRVESLKRAAAEAPDHRTRKQLELALRSRQEANLMAAIDRHLDAQYQTMPRLFYPPSPRL